MNRDFVHLSPTSLLGELKSFLIDHTKDSIVEIFFSIVFFPTFVLNEYELYREGSFFIHLTTSHKNLKSEKARLITLGSSDISALIRAAISP
jgi:hypothetical protein